MKTVIAGLLSSRYFFVDKAVLALARIALINIDYLKNQGRYFLPNWCLGTWPAKLEANISVKFYLLGI